MHVDCLCVGTGRLMQITASSYFYNKTSGANFFWPLNIRSILWSCVFHAIQGIRFNIEVIWGHLNSESILSPLVSLSYVIETVFVPASSISWRISSFRHFLLLIIFSSINAVKVLAEGAT